MPRFMIKNLKSNDTIQFQAERTWVTIKRLENGKLMASLQENGSYEYYQVDEEGVDHLIDSATSILL